MLGIFVDIDNELTDIAKEVARLSDAVALFNEKGENAGETWSWLAVQG